MSINTGMKELIASVNQLHDIAAKTKIKVGWQLPQIVVVGGQSAGKSSVLESFVGRDFLPRGVGLCTRRPLILQLRTFDGDSYACFGHDQKKLTDFDEVRKEIERDTERVTGCNKGLSNEPILLKVFSPEVLDLTLVDLPGLTKVPVGDQPEDIEKQIEDMIIEFITEENSIILAVTPANIDMANSDALKLARKVDPDGKRTIGVMTKLDLMDEGTDAKDIFQGKENKFVLKKGYVGMVNRSQKDIESNRSIQDAITKENEYFKTSPYWDMMDRMGTKVLQSLLNKELHKHIKENMPSIRKNLLDALRSNEKSLRDLGYGFAKERSPRVKATTLILEFSDDVSSRFHGQGASVYGDEVTGGAIIGEMYYTDVKDEINRVDEEISDKQIEIWSANYAGTMHGNRLDHDDRVIKDAVKELTPRYIKHLENCVDMVKDQVEKTVANAANTILNGHPLLIQEVLDLMNIEIIENQQKSKDLLKSFAEAHAFFTNLNHPDFISLKKKNEYVNGDMPPDWTADDMTRNSPTTSIKEQNIPDNFENEEIFRGNMSLLTTGALSLHKNKEVLVVLSRKTLFIHSIMKNKEINRIMMDGCNVDSVSDPRGGGKRFTIYRLDGRMIQKEKSIEFLSPGHTADQWIEAFKEIGIYQKEIMYSSSLSLFSEDDQPERKKSPNRFGKIFKKESSNRPSRGKDHDMISREPQYLSAAKRYKPLIKAYMNILNVAFQDTTPKYIEKVLVMETVDFAKKYLLSGIQGRLPEPGEEPYAKLLDSNDKEKQMKKQKIADLVESCEALKEALDLECFSKW